MTPCEKYGHTFVDTGVPGHFRCIRDVGRTQKNKVVQCNTIAICPACVGYCSADAVNLFCSDHAAYTLEQFPVRSGASLPHVFEPIKGEQHQLF